MAVFAFESIASGGTKPVPVAGVEAFDDSAHDVPGRPVLVPTPGHTSGHCSFDLPDHGILITDDALVNRNALTNRPGPRLMPRIFSHNWKQSPASADVLAAVDAGVLLPGHGEPLHMQSTEAVAQAKQRSADAGWWDRRDRRPGRSGSRHLYAQPHGGDQCSCSG